ncbi:MAG: hypothetical protein ACE37L_09625 [Allomuricauda sp.]|uniref:Uncharacterized protein n=1 Tax=Flagellimonas oceani TaxID=2698672 RepID=A0A6G7J813_9FLAO|nr:MULTISPECIES: hypothetical protein [Allomuricauda]MBW8241862.1 hypothetical protein [Allomuricauda oceani]QII46779.1 hypothetical protein GVT53_19535 [Allomuricauda oceani]
MEKKPLNVRLIGKKGNYYQIQFPNLQTPVNVDETAYHRMLHSEEYEFDHSRDKIKRPSYSA